MSERIEFIKAYLESYGVTATDEDCRKIDEIGADASIISGNKFGLIELMNGIIAVNRKVLAEQDLRDD